MNIETQETADLNQLASLIDGMSIAMLSGVERDGSLVSRPMTPLEMDGDGALWFFTDARSEKTERLIPMNLSFSGESHSIYVSISGHGEVVRDREHVKRLWTPYAKPWFLEGPESPHLVLLKFVPHSADYWDAPHSKMLRLVAMNPSTGERSDARLNEARPKSAPARRFEDAVRTSSARRAHA
ncbi:pyridoxamine 5'-phosphate oxidase family protein [Methylibium sp.]|uniref:pyridoxamine 5'-phosphate oxidase family protein n=1 Tax=Methylibium sp. TaxID=2067992 RepID=UPI003341206B